MLAKDRVFAIRAGAYTSSDIKEASFNYGYISGDTLKPGGTVAGSAKLTFTSIITSFNKLDKVYPEIGLKVGDSFEWVAMGEYFVNDINIDRNRNTTELDLMDGMFKLNQPYISDLTYPAQIRDVIREICVKTGVELETDDLGFRAIQHHIQSKADKKDITFREVLSQAIQLLGFSAFFNRQGKLEVRGLTESRITVTADNYFLHGLTKSEIQYQIAGITCKKDKETLTVGLRTGRSLELENSFMNQNLLDELYYELKDIKYYPFSLDWQGHLKLDVGQWVTLKTNKNETYKVPVLSQSFSFKGGLKSKISADSKAGNDTQYSYKGFLTKQIEQMSTQIDAEIQQQLEYKDKEFDEKINKVKSEINDGIEQSKAEAERYADQIKTEISQEFDTFEQEYQATKQSQSQQIADILAKAQANTILATDAKNIGNQAKADAANALSKAIQYKNEAISEATRLDTVERQATETKLATAKSQAISEATRLDTVERQATETKLATAKSQAISEATRLVETAKSLLSGQISNISTDLSQTKEAIKLLATKATVDTLTGRVSSAEAMIQVQADQISQRVKTSDFDQAKQRISTAESSITQLGNRITTEISETVAKIPTEIGGRNYFRGYKYNEEITLNSYQNVGSFTQFYNRLTYNLPESDGKTFTISFEAISPNGETPLEVYNRNQDPQYFNFPSRRIGIVGTIWQKFIRTVTVATQTVSNTTNSNRIEIYAPNKTGVRVRNIKVELGNISTDWSPAPEDVVTEIENVKTIITQTAEGQVQLSNKLTETAGKVTAAETSIRQLVNDVSSKVSQTIFDNLKRTVESQGTTISQNQSAIALKADKTVTDQLSKSIEKTNAELKVTSDAVNTKVSSVDFNVVSGRLTTAETTIKTMAGTIETKLSRTDTEGIVTNAITQSENGTNQRISQVEGKIPTNLGGTNLVRGSAELKRGSGAWSQGHWRGSGSGGKVEYNVTLPSSPIKGIATGAKITSDNSNQIGLCQDGTSLEAGTYTLSVWVLGASGLKVHVSSAYSQDTNNPYTAGNKFVTLQDNSWTLITQTFTLTKRYNNISLAYLMFDSPGTVYFAAPYIHASELPGDWSPAPEDVVTEIENVKTIITQTAEGQVQLSNKLTETAGKVTAAETSIRQLVNDVSSKVSQTDYNTLTGRVDSAETAITQNATEISKRLTSTQVESAITGKGYQTKSQVDDNITGRGYITNSALQPYALSTTVQNLVQETADSFSRTISRVENKIPTKIGVTNLLGGTSSDWKTIRVTQYNGLIKSYNPQEWALLGIKTGDSVTFSVDVKTTSGKKLRSRISFYGANTHYYSEAFVVNGEGRLSVTGVVPDGITSVRLFVDANLTVATNTGVTEESCRREKLEIGAIATDWSPAPEDLATVTALHSVRDTVDSHTRTIGAVGETGSILDNVSKVTQTAAGLVTEVSGTNGLKIQVSQLAGSWAVQNLTSSGQILNQINLLANGTNRIDGRLTHITGQTLIDNGVIINAMIGNLDAGKIKTGTLDAARIRANSIDGSKIVFDQAFLNKMTANEALFKQLFAQSAFITSVQAVAVSAKQIAGGIAKALNGGMDVNFDESKINFYTNVAAIRRIYTGHPTQFIKFETEGNYSRTIIGSNRNGGEVFNSATFAGIVVENTNNINTEDNVRIYGDNTLLRHAQGDVGWNINSVTQRIVPANMNAESEIWSKHFVAPDKNSKPVRLDTAVAALWDIWNHIIYNNFEFNAALRTHIKARRDNWKFELNL
nr:gp58-like family protein [Streptococcus suis]